MTVQTTPYTCAPFHFDSEGICLTCEKVLRLNLFGWHHSENRFWMYEACQIPDVTDAIDAEAYRRFKIWRDKVHPKMRAVA